MLRALVTLTAVLALAPAGAAVPVSRYLEVDQMVGGGADARPAFAAVAAKVGGCPEIGREAGPHVRCLLAALDEFRQDGDGKLSTLLLERRGDPYAVTAALLLLHGDPARLHAVVLGTHVLIGLQGIDDWYFDPLNGGREMTAGYAFSTYGLPFSRAEEADVDRFLGHYASHLAAASPSEKLYRLAVKASPGSGRVRHAFGAWLLRQNRIDEAREQLAKSTELGPDDFDAWMDRGTALEKAERFKAARRSYAQALRVDPRSKAAADKLRAMDAKIDEQAAKEEP